jgi:hypothetical protein
VQVRAGRHRSHSNDDSGAAECPMLTESTSSHGRQPVLSRQCRTVEQVQALSSGQGEQSKLAVSSASVGPIDLRTDVLGKIREDAVVLRTR